MSGYLPEVAVAMSVCLGLVRLMPAWRTPLIVVSLLLLASTVFDPDIALGVRLFGAVLTAMLAAAFVQLRRAQRTGD